MLSSAQKNRRQWLKGMAAASLAVPATSLPKLALAQSTIKTTPKAPMPPEGKRLGNDAFLQGSLRFRYWGFHVYDAALWVLPGFDAAKPLATPFMLSLSYARDITAQDLAERSLEEVARQMEVLPAQAERWMGLMRRAFVNVSAGDRISGMYLPPDKAAFFHNGRLTAEWQDAQFAPAFFGIWLSEQTSEPRMRRALLGLDADNRRARAD